MFRGGKFSPNFPHPGGWIKKSIPRRRMVVAAIMRYQAGLLVTLFSLVFLRLNGKDEGEEILPCNAFFFCAFLFTLSTPCSRCNHWCKHWLERRCTSWGLFTRLSGEFSFFNFATWEFLWFQPVSWFFSGDPWWQFDASFTKKIAQEIHEFQKSWGALRSPRSKCWPETWMVKPEWWTWITTVSQHILRYFRSYPNGLWFCWSYVLLVFSRLRLRMAAYDINLRSSVLGKWWFVKFQEVKIIAAINRFGIDDIFVSSSHCHRSTLQRASTEGRHCGSISARGRRFSRASC